MSIQQIHSPEFFLRIEGKPDYHKIQNYYRRCQAENRLHVVIWVERRRRYAELGLCMVTCSWEHLQGRYVLLSQGLSFTSTLRRLMTVKLENVRNGANLPEEYKPKLKFDWRGMMLTFRNIPEDIADPLAREICSCIGHLLNELSRD